MASENQPQDNQTLPKEITLLIFGLLSTSGWTGGNKPKREKKSWISKNKFEQTDKHKDISHPHTETQTFEHRGGKETHS